MAPGREERRFCWTGWLVQAVLLWAAAVGSGFFGRTLVETFETNWMFATGFFVGVALVLLFLSRKLVAAWACKDPDGR